MSTALNTIEGKQSKNNRTADELYDTIVRAWDIPTKITREGELADVSRAKELARDREAFEERFDDSSFFLRMAVGATAEAEQGDDTGDIVSRAATVAETRADGVIDAGVVQDSTPIEVDPVIVDIQDTAAPLREEVTFEAQPGFTAQFNIISDRNEPTPGKVSEGEAVDLTDNDNADWTLDNEQLDMTIYVDRMTMSDFTQRAWESLNWGTNDIEETTVGQSVTKHARFTAWEMIYGDPDPSDETALTDDNQIQGDHAAASLAYWADFADSEDITEIDHVKDKSGVDVNDGSDGIPGLEDLKSEVTELVTETGASYADLIAVCGPDAFDEFSNEPNRVTRLDGYDAAADVEDRRIRLKSGVELVEVRQVGKDSVEDVPFEDGGSDWTPQTGDVFIFDTSTFRRRQLAPASSVPLARRGLSDEAALFEYYNNIEKSHGAHVKFLEGYDVA